MKKNLLKYGVVLSLGVVLVAALAFALVGSASAATTVPCRTKPCPTTDDSGQPDDTGCDGGRVARRWNSIEGDWERDFCDDLFYAVPTNDPFDAVFGYNHGYYGWDYGQAIQYLLDQGFGSGQLSTYQGQVNALVSLGLWNTTTHSIPAGADLSFLTLPHAEQGPNVISNLPMQ